NSSLSLLAPMAASVSASWWANAGFGRSPGNSCHSTCTGLLPSEDKSGRPTKAHSAFVLTSIRTEAASRLSLAHVSSTERESMWTSPPTLPTTPLYAALTPVRQYNALPEQRRTSLAYSSTTHY